MLFSAMKKFALTLINITIVFAGFAMAQSTVTKSSVTFQVRNLGISVTGNVSGLKADIQFNPGNLAIASIDASVDANTISTDNSSRDEHLKEAEFFDPAHYPRIIMKSVSFKHRSGSNYTGFFNLTIKNKTKLVEVPFVFMQKGSAMTFKGSFKINRLDFGVGDSSLILSNEVTVDIEAEIRD